MPACPASRERALQQRHMITAWHIVKKRNAARAFNGDGARLFGGRWNSPGIPVVYLAGTPALAVLEMAVHLDRPGLLGSFVLIPCEFDDAFVARVHPSALPREWRRSPAPAELAGIGDEWVERARSAVLAVPSAVIQQETNYLLNPRHPDFSRIRRFRDFCGSRAHRQAASRRVVAHSPHPLPRKHEDHEEDI
jgi:RES domain-containing protein